MNTKNHTNLYLALFSLASLVLLVSACSPAAAREWLKAPGWSHGQAIEETRTNDPVAITLDEAGGIYLFLITAVNDDLHPKVIALNRQAEIVWQQSLPVSLSQPDKPSMLWDGQTLQLFWLADQSLYQAQMNSTGNVMGSPQLLSGDKVVDDYDLALNGRGQVTVWYAGQRRDPGLYAFFDGNLSGEAVLVDAEGVRPSLQYDDTGTLQATWAHYPPGFEDTTFFYEAYPDGVYQPEGGTAVHQPTLKVSDILAGPWLGLDNQQAYLIWNISVRTGPEAGKALTEYLYFPQGEPDQVTGPQPIIVPAVADLEYAYQPDGGLAAGLRVDLNSSDYPGTPSVTDVAVNGTAYPEKELALAFDAQVQHEFRKERAQIGVYFLQNGHPTGYQLLSFSPNASSDPAIISDETGSLYLTWLERGQEGSFQIYFASTAPDIQEALSGATTGDINRIARETAFGLVSGAVLSPLVVLLWMIAPLVVLFLTSFLRPRDEEKLTNAGTIISLLLAAAVYWVVKLATIPGISSHVPFSAWIPAIPLWLQASLQIAVPLVSTIVAVGLAWHFTYRRRSPSLLYFAILFVAVDGLLTMAIYGFLFYNVI